MSTMSQLGEFIGARLKTLAEKIATALSDAKAYTDEKIAALVDSAPETLDTLKEIADQITDNKTVLDAITDAVTAHEHDTATTEKAGFMSAADKIALDNIGTFDDFLASYELRISDLEGNGGSTGPILASQALEEYDFLLCSYIDTYSNKNAMAFLSACEHRMRVGDMFYMTNPPHQDQTVKYLLNVNEGDIVKAYTPDLQEIEIIADSTLSHSHRFGGVCPMAFCNVETREVRCYQLDSDNKIVSPCTDEEFIAQYGNSAAYGL